MKRFYRQVSAVPAPGGFQIALDGRPVRTPLRAPLVVPCDPLADAIAAEWEAQTTKVDPRTMPLTKLVNTAIDRVASNRETALDTVAGFAETDLVFYRAADPPDLAARQDAAWRPLIEWAESRYAIALEVTGGVMPVAQPQSAIGALRAAADREDDFALAALYEVTTLTGSLIVALAVREGRISAHEAVAASQVDEAWQFERWGRDEAGLARLAALAAEIETACRFLDLLSRR